MLVLTRKPNETLTITPPGQSPIIITLVAVCGNRVRFGVDADRAVKVRRTEIAEDIDYEKRGAK